MKGNIMEQVKPITSSKGHTLPVGQAFLKGRVANRRRINGNEGTYWLTVVKLPARDEFSHPGTVEIMSRTPIGDVNDDWQGVVDVTGYPRSYNSKPDPETGEIRKISSADIRLRVVTE
jgi:hypothetical protein